MFDVNTIRDKDLVEVEVKNPKTGEGVGAFVTIAGPEHPDRKALEFARQRRVREEVQRNRRVPVGDPEEEAAEALDVLVACTFGWRGFGDKGVEIPFTKDAARALFSRPELAWLRGQLLLDLQRGDLFIETSATS